jgi:hypothetical protein
MVPFIDTYYVSFVIFCSCFNMAFGVHADSNRWFALIRIWSPWLAPRQGKAHFDLDKEAVMCSFLSLTGKHLVLLAISGVDDVMTLLTSIDGAVNLHVSLTGTNIFDRNATDYLDRYKTIPTIRELPEFSWDSVMILNLLMLL